MPKKGKKGKKGKKDPGTKEPFVPPWHKGKPLWYTRGFIADGGTTMSIKTRAEAKQNGATQREDLRDWRETWQENIWKEAGITEHGILHGIVHQGTIPNPRTNIMASFPLQATSMLPALATNHITHAGAAGGTGHVHMKDSFKLSPALSRTPPDMTHPHFSSSPGTPRKPRISSPESPRKSLMIESEAASSHLAAAVEEDCWKLAHASDPTARAGLARGGQLPTIGILRHCASPRTRVSEQPQRDISERLRTVQACYDKQKALRAFRWQKVGEEEENIEKDKKTAQVQNLPKTQPVPLTALHAGAEREKTRGPLSCTSASKTDFKKPRWRTPRRLIERSLVVTGGCTIEPLFARGQDSASSSDDDEAFADGDEQVLQALRRRCHHKQALFQAFASLPAREDPVETPRRRRKASKVLHKYSYETSSDEDQHSPHTRKPSPRAVAVGEGEGGAIQSSTDAHIDTEGNYEAQVREVQQEKVKLPVLHSKKLVRTEGEERFHLLQKALKEATEKNLIEYLRVKGEHKKAEARVDAVTPDAALGAVARVSPVETEAVVGGTSVDLPPLCATSAAEALLASSRASDLEPPAASHDAPCAGELKGVMHGWLWKRNKESHCNASGDRSENWRERLFFIFHGSLQYMSEKNSSGKTSCDLAHISSIKLVSFPDSGNQHAFQIEFASEKPSRLNPHPRPSLEPHTFAASSPAEVAAWIGALVGEHKHVQAMAKFMKQEIAGCRRKNSNMDRLQLNQLLSSQYQQLAPEEKEAWEKRAAIVRVRHLPKVDSKDENQQQEESPELCPETGADEDFSETGADERSDEQFVAFSHSSSRDVSAPSTAGLAQVWSSYRERKSLPDLVLEEDLNVEMRGPRHPSPVKMSKRFMQEEEMLGNKWLDKRAAEMVYLERCEEQRVLPLSTCLQSVLRPRAQTADRFFGDSAGATESDTADHSLVIQVMGTPSAHAQQTHNRQVGEREEEETVLVSVRHYGMGATAMHALVSWLACRAGIHQLALCQDALELETAAALSGIAGGQTAFKTLKASGKMQRVVVDLSGNSMRAHGSSALMQELGLCLHLPTRPPSAELAGCRITEIDLSRNDIGCHLSLLFEPPRDRYPTLLRSHQLRRLNLSDVGLTDVCGESLSRALLHNSTLTAMDVSKNRLASRSSLALAQVLVDGGSSGKHAAALTSLNMSWNAIDGNSRGGLALCAILGSSSVSLTSLDLSWNPIRETGAVSLGQALRRNEASGSLRDLNLAHTRVTEAAAVMLGFLLVNNSQLTALHMSGNPIGFHGARALFRLLVARQSHDAQRSLGPSTNSSSSKETTAQEAEHHEIGGKDEKRFWISRRGCSLTASTKMGLKMHRPEGRYVLDLSVLSERGVALELAVLARELSLNAPGSDPSEWWKVCRKVAGKDAGSKVDMDPWPLTPWLIKPFSASGADDSLYPLPLQGILEVHFEMPLKHKTASSTSSLGDSELHAVLTLAACEVDSPHVLDPTNIAGLWNVAGFSHLSNLTASAAAARGEGKTRDALLGAGALETPRFLPGPAFAGANTRKVEEGLLKVERLAVGASDMEKSELLSASIINGYWRFSVAQARGILAQVSSMTDRVTLIMRLLPFLLDLENVPSLLRLVHPNDVSRLQSQVGELLFFSPLRPVRRWRLNLQDDYDRTLALVLQELSMRENAERERLSLPDTSQNANRVCWRNVLYNGKTEPGRAANAGAGGQDKGGEKGKKKKAAPVQPKVPVAVECAHDWHIPQHGLLELDYTSCHRPLRTTTPVSHKDLQQHVASIRSTVRLILRQSPCHLPSCFGTAALRPVTQMLLLLPLSAAQAVQLCAAAHIVGQVPHRIYPVPEIPLDDPEAPDVPLDAQQMQELGIQASLRAELMQRMFQNIIDLENLYQVMSKTLTEQDCEEIGKRLGLLNFWNPLQPGCSIDLRLEVPDERRMAVTLINLASYEDVDATPRTARGIGAPEPLALAGDTKKGYKTSEPADCLPPAGTTNITYEAEKETARMDARLLMARESFLVGELVSGSDDDTAAIQPLQSSQ